MHFARARGTPTTHNFRKNAPATLELNEASVKSYNAFMWEDGVHVEPIIAPQSTILNIFNHHAKHALAAAEVWTIRKSDGAPGSLVERAGGS